jgi:type I restriction enzyme S subunit
VSGLPPGWVETTLGEIAEVIRGVTYKKAEADSAPGDGLVPLLRATNIVGGGLELGSELVYVPSSRVSDAQLLVVGDIVIAASSGSRAVVGKSAPLRHEWMGTFGAFCSVARPRLAIDASYIGSFVGSEGVRRRWSRLATGTSINNLKREHFTETPVPLPPLNEQQRIVAAIEEHLSRLDAADASLTAASQRLKPLQRHARSLAVAHGEVCAVGDLLESIEAGKSFRCHGRRAGRDEWGVIKVSAMTWGAFDEDENKAVISEERVDPRWEIREGDLLLSRANTTELVGATVLVGSTRPRLLLSDKSMRLHAPDSVDKAWLQMALSAPESRRQMSAVATGTKDSMRNISQEKVKAVRLRVPPLEEQRRIVAEIDERLGAIDALRAAIARAQRKGAALRRSVLERAFCGELVPQDPSDEPASVLLDRIRSERAATGPRRGG